VGWGSRCDPQPTLAWGSIDVGLRVGWGGVRESVGASAKTLTSPSQDGLLIIILIIIIIIVFIVYSIIYSIIAPWYAPLLLYSILYYYSIVYSMVYFIIAPWYTL